MQWPLSLSGFSSRTLNLIAGLVAERPATLMLSQRSRHPIQVIMKSNTIVLDPTLCHLLELLLAAQILRERPRMAEAKALQRRPLPAKTVASWVATAVTDLVQRFPGAESLPGNLARIVSRRQDVSISWRTAEWKPLGDSSEAFGGLGMEGAPELEIVGCEEDFRWLVDGIEAGRVPIKHLDGFPELCGMAEIPLNLNLPNFCPQMEQIEELIAQNERTIESLMKCIRSKSEVREERLPLGRHVLSGTNLDGGRLVDAAIARRAGGLVMPRIFRRPATNIEPIYDPSQHIAIFCMDLNSLKPGDLGDPGFSQRFLAALTTAYGRLGVDMCVIGTMDQVLRMGNDEAVYLHVPLVLKDVDEEVDESFWRKIMHFRDGKSGSFPGCVPACLPHLLVRKVRRKLEQLMAEGGYSYVSVLLAAKRFMPAGEPEYWSEEFLTRAAAAVDEEYERIEQLIDSAGFDAQAMFLAEEVREHAPPGGMAANSF